MEQEQITSRQNPLMVRLRKLGTSRRLRREEGVFLCEGPKLVAEAVKWGASIETLVRTDRTSLSFEPPEGVRMVSVSEELLRSVSTVETPQGVMAVCRQPETRLPERLTGRQYLLLDGVQDPGNVGTIWRTADGFGADGLILVNGCADPYSPKTVRSTMGAVFRLPVWELELEQAAALLREADIPLYTTALRSDTADVRTLDLSAAAVVIGSEGRGASEEALRLCCRTVGIPMTERCESLNAAVAASVILWEMGRSRL